MYFQIRCDEDGLSVEKVEDIEQFLEECVEEKIKFLNDFPRDRWNGETNRLDAENYPDENEVILIKGDVVVPQAVSRVTKYGLI